jgi:serine/threonine protein kinase
MFDFESQQLNLIDFGLSGSYLNQYGVHIPFRSTQTILGTPLFASNNALLGKEISRRDDIESMMYILIFCIKG